MNIVVAAFVKYIQTHPEVLEKLIEKLIDELIKHLDAQ